MIDCQVIRKAQEEIAKFFDELRTAVKEAFPPGTIVHFKKWGHDIDAEVLSVREGFGHQEPELNVRNIYTGKEYRILLYDVLERGTCD